jgi:hypothetical protein
MMPNRTHMSHHGQDDEDEEDADLVLEALPVEQPLSPAALSVPSLMRAVVQLRDKAEQVGDEQRALAAARLLACLRCGPIDAVADTLTEYFLAIIETE